MGWSIEVSLRSLLLFLELFHEGVPDDGNLPFANVTTELAVSPCKQKSRALLSRYSYLLFYFLKLLGIILDSPRQAPSMTSTIFNYLFRCVILEGSFLLEFRSEECSLIHLWFFFLLTNPRQIKELLMNSCRLTSWCWNKVVSLWYNRSIEDPICLHADNLQIVKAINT